jgi:uncharacterized membrane protein
MFRAKEQPMSIAVCKSLTYGGTHLVVAIAVAFAVTRDWRAALAVGLIEPVVQTIAYTLHERAWAKAGARVPFRFGHAH